MQEGCQKTKELFCFWKGPFLAIMNWEREDHPVHKPFLTFLGAFPSFLVFLGKMG